jgi:hypothetical protein
MPWVRGHYARPPRTGWSARSRRRRYGESEIITVIALAAVAVLLVLYLTTR